MPRIYVGTVGQSVWRSDDGGNSFRRASSGIAAESHIRALVSHPFHPEIMFVGTEHGLYRSEDGGDKWRHIPSPMDGRQVWSIAFGLNPKIVVAGSCPASFHRSTDGGETWKTVADSTHGLAQDCFGGSMITRVTSMIPHRTDENILFAGVEVDGVYKSTDAGATWVHSGLPQVDVHDLKLLGDGTLIAAANNEIHRSRDGAKTWEALHVKEHFFSNYCRGMGIAPNNDNLLFSGMGNGPPGSAGGVYKTSDAGDTWTRVPLNGIPNSTVWQFASSGSWMLASTNLGQLYRSTDNGDNWAKLAWEFGEIRGLVVVA